MATKKKNNSRKALAVALGIMGVAGLSMASASQLTINSDANIATGTTTVIGDACATEVDVEFTTEWNGDNFYHDIDGFTVADLSDCDGLSLEYRLFDEDDVAIAGANNIGDEFELTGLATEEIEFDDALDGYTEIGRISITIS